MIAGRACLDPYMLPFQGGGLVDAVASKKPSSMDRITESLKKLPPISALRHFSRFVIAVASASITYLHEQIRKAVNAIFFHSQNAPIQRINQPIPIKPTNQTPATPPVPPNLLDMPPKFLASVLNRLALKDIAACASVSKNLQTYTDSPDLWHAWATRLSMPWEKNDEIKNKMVTLLTHFKVNPTTGLPTTLKSTDNIENALAAYPFPAKVLIPSLIHDGYQLYYREASGNFHIIEVEEGDKLTENRLEANKIFNDNTYTELEIII